MTLQQVTIDPRYHDAVIFNLDAALTDTNGALLPHVNMPATVFVASCAGCPRQLIGGLVCWCPRGRCFALGS
ncbi:hypothetical protein, partial [Mycobacterium sp.]|uniref:hypothetical protein n=1 Tax=Mycobacterium sp. TaxID=1785 RepID=UPI003F9A3B0E